jgi:DNA replicative helicase MCM subunit Mcm2 (Cdc46/Mcm family)
MGRTSTTWESGSTWQSGETTLIRVPIVLKNQILDYARAVDSKLINHVVPLQGDFLQQFTIRLIERYIEYKRQNYHPNQNSRKLDTSTRAWDELRKFQKFIQENPERLLD